MNKYQINVIDYMEYSNSHNINVLSCLNCVYEKDCPSEIHCQNCARMYTDLFVPRRTDK